MSYRRLLALLVAALFLAGCDGAAGPGDAATVPDTTDGAADGEAAVGSYARGLITGRQNANPSLDREAFMEGLTDGLEGGDPRYTDDELRAGLESFARVEMEANNALAQANVAAGEAFLVENREVDGVVETPSGLQYMVLEEGDGPKPEATNVVRVHYHGTTLDGETFDSSYDAGEPAEFPLNGVIPGWTEGVQLMSVGSKYKFWIPQELGYGMQARPGAPFGPGATLVFEVELLEIVQ